MLHQFLRENFPYTEFRPLQHSIIERCLEGKNTLAILPTGGGKSLIYQFCAKKYSSDLKATGEKPLVLVLSPLIALMQDQFDRARKLGISVSFLASTVPAEEREKRLQKIGAGQFELLFVTPERFKNARFREVIASRKVKLLVVDEAHCVSLWSHDFRPEYGKIQGMREFLGNPPVLALTATATPEVRKDILSKMGLVVGTEIAVGGVGDGLRLSAAETETVSVPLTEGKTQNRTETPNPKREPPTEKHNETQVLIAPIERPEIRVRVEDCFGFDAKLEIIKANLEAGKPTLIYFLLIETLEKVARELRKMKLPHRVYHGDLLPSQRQRNQRDFVEDRDWLMLATPAFGLGVDKPNIRKVFHFEMPGSIEAYFQEIGRSGRDGLESEAALLFDEEDVAIVMEFLKWSYPEEAFIKALFAELKTNLARYNSEGVDSLREKMSFKNKRDYRIESALSILERWGCISRTPGDRPQFEILTEPTAEDFAQEQQKFLQKQQNIKLLEMLRWAKNDQQCRMQRIYEYFGFHTEICGECDICQRAP